MANRGDSGFAARERKPCGGKFQQIFRDFFCFFSKAGAFKGSAAIKTKSFLTFVFVCFAPALSFGAESGKALEKSGKKVFPAAVTRRVIIRSLGAKVHFKKNSSHDYQVEWQGAASVENKEGDLVIEEAGYHEVKSWGEAGGKPLKVTVSGPGGAPVSVFAFSVSVHFVRWEAPVFVSSLSGQIQGEGNKGPWRLSLREGALDIKGHSGDVEAKGFRAASNFQSGKGNFRWQFSEGSLRFTEGQGAVDFSTDKGEVRIKKFKGSLKGSSKSGPVRASMEPDQVEVYSSEGTLRFHFMGYGAELVAYSERGKIYAPRRLSRDFSGRAYKVMGRLKGKPKKGKISLKTNTGAIYIN